MLNANIKVYKVENEGLLDIILLLEIIAVNNLVNIMHGKYLAPQSPFSTSFFVTEINNSL